MRLPLGLVLLVAVFVSSVSSLLRFVFLAMSIFVFLGRLLRFMSPVILVFVALRALKFIVVFMLVIAAVTTTSWSMHYLSKSSQEFAEVITGFIRPDNNEKDQKDWKEAVPQGGRNPLNES